MRAGSDAGKPSRAAGARARAAALETVEAWFRSRGKEPFDFQREVWSAYLDGESGLIHAATGTGKTYAAWLGPLAEEMLGYGAPPPDGASLPSDPAPYPSEPLATAKRLERGLRVLWVTPLRALAGDTAAALAQPLQEMGIPWSVETRTGDTAAAIRARQGRRLPRALITTPESLSLLISRPDAHALFVELRAVVVDEWHELMGSKRGVQTELAIARLRGWCPELRVWGLSATLGNLHDSREALLGPGRGGRIVRGLVPKTVVIDAVIPPVMERFPWSGHLTTRMLPQVLEAIEEGDTALVFTNTRSQTEIWYRAILEARPTWAGEIALHHGSLDRKARDWVEAALRDGRLRCVVATSTLDLGVDFAPVDRVLQIGSPKGVARLLQRGGRSGHSPGRQSRVTCVPTNAWELVEVAAARDAVESGQVESRLPVERPLDVLVQHLVTVALGGGFRPDDLLAEVRSTRAYAELRDDEWAWALDFVTRGGSALTAYPEFSRVVEREGIFVVEDRRIAHRHRMAIGTIVSDAAIRVQYLRGAKLGTVEESFIARLRPGDRFMFGGKPLEFVRVRDMVAWVRRARSTKGAIPRWMGSRLPLSSELARAVRGRLDEARRGILRDPEMNAIRPILELQARWSAIPAADELLIERVKTAEGHHIFIYPIDGRLVHEGIAALFAYRISRIVPISFAISANDYGFELLAADPAPLEQALAEGLLLPRELAEDIPASLNAAEMARRQFREIARVAGLVFPGFPGSGKSARQLQASSGLFYDVFRRYDPENRLLEQASREVLERQLESSRLGRTLERLASSRVVIRECDRPTPMGFPLLVDRNRVRVSSESLPDRVRKMQLRLEREAG